MDSEAPLGGTPPKWNGKVRLPLLLDKESYNLAGPATGQFAKGNFGIQ